MGQAFVSCDNNVNAAFLRYSQQFAVLEAVPLHVADRANVSTAQSIPQFVGQILVEQNPHRCSCT